MTIRRVVPAVPCADIPASTTFYGLLGFEEVMNHGWVAGLASPSTPAAQVLLVGDDPSGVRPDLSIEVDDVDTAHADMVRHGADIVYGISDEPWGVRRFFVRDPNGRIVNVLTHQ
ncbi:VOC family protein [Kibdelosporangium persicum]|uniref:Lactoylglutathione lyase n=1 Tax=Kibdelosporangium persicum TaxID=2698649 RepID=A0ABX2F2R6_9PSEU|nr:VOC family protein [Kibdelosporangium persicum]NRN65631.1 Lactoylglutathione lyase [Kibdelosporangium persicum]